LEVGADMSYRQGVKLLNQLLHRNKGSVPKRLKKKIGVRKRKY